MMGADNNIQGTVVTGVIGEDVHIVGIRIIEQALNDNGFKVSSMGAQVSQEEFINAALETNADAISSIFFQRTCRNTGSLIQGQVHLKQVLT
ncbi:MAG: cobalamin-dependent protein [Dethiobacteria bacterium]